MKTIIYILIFLILLFLQTNIAQSLQIFNAVPAFVLVFLILWIHENEKETIVLALLLGLIFDLVFAPVFGVYTLGNLLALLLVRYLNKHFFSHLSFSSAVLTVGAGSMAWYIVYLTIALIFGKSNLELLGTVILITTYSILLALIFVKPLEKLSEAIKVYEGHRRGVIR